VIADTFLPFDARDVSLRAFFMRRLGQNTTLAGLTMRP